MNVVILIVIFIILLIAGIVEICTQHGLRGLTLAIIAFIILKYICQML